MSSTRPFYDASKLLCSARAIRSRGGCRKAPTVKDRWRWRFDVLAGDGSCRAHGTFQDVSDVPLYSREGLAWRLLYRNKYTVEASEADAPELGTAVTVTFALQA